MRYMLLIYSDEQRPGPDRETYERNYNGHRALIDDAKRKGVFEAAEPLAPTSSATTLRNNDGKLLVTDGPFAETKEQLAGYYILDCANLDEAIEWASRIPTVCRGRVGSVEIRPLPGMPAPPEVVFAGSGDAVRNG